MNAAVRKCHANYFGNLTFCSPTGGLDSILGMHGEGIEGSSQLFLLQWNPDTDKPEVRSWDELYGELKLSTNLAELQATSNWPSYGTAASLCWRFRSEAKLLYDLLPQESSPPIFLLWSHRRA